MKLFLSFTLFFVFALTTVVQCIEIDNKTIASDQLTSISNDQHQHTDTDASQDNCQEHCQTHCQHEHVSKPYPSEMDLGWTFFSELDLAPYTFSLISAQIRTDERPPTV